LFIPLCSLSIHPDYQIIFFILNPALFVAEQLSILPLQKTRLKDRVFHDSKS